MTQTGEQTAIYCLQQNEWKLDQASDNYFQAPEYYYRELDRKRIEQLYIRYQDPLDHSKMTSDGIMKFLDDLGLPVDSKEVLIVAWKFRAATQCEFSREEFINGMHELGADSIEKLNVQLPMLAEDLKDPVVFKDFYQFTFNYAKDSTQKGLDVDMAIAYWRIVLKGRFKFLEFWCEFLKVRETYKTKQRKLTTLIFF